MDLDDTARLFAEAQAKLAELDNRVAVYRHQMAAEFNRFSGEQLQNVPPDLAYQVSQAVAESLVNYPHLFPPGSHRGQTSPLESPTEPNDSPWRNKGSPPPILLHTSGTPKEPHRSTHERELEFQGLFTPTYLPLLDSADRPIHSPPTSPGAEPTPNLVEKLATRNPQTSEGTQTSEAPQTPDQTPITEPTPTSEGTQTSGSPQARPRPSPLRRATDASIDSTASDSSSVKVRKSALRRSSAASSRAPDSPRDTRRVRFEVQGQEVLPSSSPQASTTALAEVVSASPENSAALADTALPVTSLGDVDGEDDPPPRKVSSSQALRALSKEPLDPATWTVVNPGSEDSSSDADRASENLSRTASMSAENRDEMPPKNIPIHVKPAASGRHGESHAEESDGLAEAEDEATVEMVERVQVEEESSEDEDPLMIMSKKDFKKKLKANDSQTTTTTDPVETVGSGRKLNPAAKPEPVATKRKPASVPPTKRAEPAEGDAEDDEDDMFNLEADDGDETLKKAISARGSPSKHLPEPTDEEPEDSTKSDEQSEGELDEREAQFKPNAPIQSSPPIGVPINKTTDIPPKVPLMPQGSVPKMSVGSYGGKPISMAPVKNPELLEKIAQSEDARPFFVGSVNGRSGPDPSNAKSYRESLPSSARGGYTFMERWMREKEEGVKYAGDKEDDEKENEKKE
ncbi:hypothetical protein KVR01_013427 [Diaporthe batatas]|uniref:uncharacterized protein n=1 Tax=Diaporthe batatas TaxID=748121 RepID=UPI001D051A62|nr:uncharacterized protein KVR01_013427 [Diaporthe batatas]KAG8156636.1 hypothetical protein KVR01_013427 [Diaporthe batatas]